MFVFILASIFSNAFAQPIKRPKIGLALSGGGAKGLAHVGVLEVIDDIGLKVDFVTGTSMGSIMGALYAIGYSGDSIHKIAASEEWDLLLSNKIPLEALTPDERLEYDKYLLEVYFEKGKLTIPSGLIDGQLLNLELTHLTNSVCDKKKFSEFPIPFQCMGANIETGQVVVLDSGNIVDAMRSSMAIPSVFTPVWYNNALLVDGGVVHNFPVSDAIAMGATIVIGVNVSTAIAKAEDLTSLTSILFQTIFMAENTDFQKQRGLANYLIEPDLTKYAISDFDQADSIIAAGRREGEKYRSVLQALKDSLEKIYPGQFVRNIQPPKEKTYYFTEVDVRGLKKHTNAFVEGRLDLKTRRPYSAKEINKSVIDLYGTRYFKKINYELQPGRDTSQNKLIVNVKEESNYAAKFAINYNSLFQSAFILNFTARHWLMRDSKLITTVNLGNNFRSRLSYGKYFGDRQASQVSIIGSTDQYDVPILLSDLSRIQISELYKMNVYRGQLNYQTQFWKYATVNTGLSADYYALKTKVVQETSFNSLHVTCYSAYLNARINTQNKIYYPTKGWDVGLGMAYMFDYRYIFRDIDGTPIDLSPEQKDYFDAIVNKSFEQANLKVSYLMPAWKKASLFYQLNGGFTFDTKHTFTHFYRVGGLRENFWHNMPFVGLKEFGTKTDELTLNNILTFQFGVQQQLLKSVYCIPRSSVGTLGNMAKDLFSHMDDPNYLLFGYGLTLAYQSFFGPLEVTMMHSNQYNDFQFYFNLGFNFYNQ